MTLTELRYIVALAREKHFGNAAQACFVSQPSLSIAIKKIEDELGIKLFERGSTEVTPTSIGEQVIAQANRVLEEVETIRHLVKKGIDPLSGILRVGVIETVGPYLMPEVLIKVKEAVPQLTINVSQAHKNKLVEMLRQGDVDLIISSEISNPSGFVVQSLFEEPLIVSMPKEHPFSSKKTISPNEISHENVVLLSHPHCFREQVLNYWPGLNRTHTFDVNGERHYDAGSLEIARYMVYSGMGISIMPLLSTKRCYFPGDDLVVYKHFTDPAPKRKIVLAWRKRYPKAEAVRVVVSAIRKCNFEEDGLYPCFDETEN